MAEEEQSLAKIPEIVTGPLVLGSMEVEPASSMTMAGRALNRITQERTEVPPEHKLPERAVYFLDPNTRRLIMVTNREPRFDAPIYRSGLFAEIVEIDDKGEPLFKLSTQGIFLPNEQYSPVAVGPNEFNLPPSFIDMMEEEMPGKQKFVPWNVYLGNLQSWMNELTIEPDDTLDSFMQRFNNLREKSRGMAEKKIKTAFPGGAQGFDNTVGPFNLIITDDKNRELLHDASLKAGLFPVVVTPDEIVKAELRKEKALGGRLGLKPDFDYQISHFLPNATGTHRPAVITDDWTAMWRYDDLIRKEPTNEYGSGTTLISVLNGIRSHNPIFSYVQMANKEDGPYKEANGAYYCPLRSGIYREFLYKAKADLLMTMFVRGGAPIVK